MKTININGKEYTESHFTKLAALEQSFKFLPDTDYGDILIEVFEDLLDDFPRPKPPTVRPMSELPEEGAFLDCLTIDLLDKSKFWAAAEFRDNRFHIYYPDYDNLAFHFEENETDFSGDGYKAIGWIQRRPLPNPNDIKL